MAGMLQVLTGNRSLRTAIDVGAALEQVFSDFFCVLSLGDGCAGEVFLGSIVRGRCAGGGDVWLIWLGDCRDVK